MGADAVPARQEPAQRSGLDGFDLGTQPCQRRAPQPAQHGGVAVLRTRLVALRAQLASDEGALGGQPVEHAGHHREPEPEPRRGVVRRERPSRPRVAAEQVAQRVGDGLGERLGHPDRECHPEGVADPARVLDRQVAFLARDAYDDRPPLRHQLVQPSGPHTAGRCLVAREVAEEPQQIRRVLGPARVPVLVEPLQRPLDLRHDVGVEQFADRLGAQEFREQRRVERQRRRPPLGQRRVGLVQEHAHVPEQQAARERRGRRGLDLHDPHGTPRDVGHQLSQPADVVDVLEALPHGLQHHGEALVLRRDAEQLRRPLPLLPQGSAPSRISSREQERPGRALAEPGREQRRPADLRGDQRLHLVRIEDDVLGADRHLPALVVECVRQPQHDPVVGVGDLRVHPAPFAQPGGHGECPRRVDLGAERGVHDHAPVAQLVAEPLQQHRPVARHVPSGLTLFVHVGHQVRGRPLVETGVLGTSKRLGTLRRGQKTQQPPQRPAQLQRPALGVTSPERHARGVAGRGYHEDAVVGDVGDPPRRRAQQDGVADPRLVHHLLVELAHAGPRPFAVARRHHGEQTAVGDRASGGDRQPLRTGPALQHARDAVPGDAGAELAELLARVPPREHVQDGVQRVVGQSRERRGPTDGRRHLLHRPRLHGHHGHDVLCQHVQRVAGIAHGLDRALGHALGHDGARDEVAPELREHHARRHRSDLVPGAADALQARRHRGRGLHLDHEVHGPHVDAELQRRGRHDARQRPRLEVLLDPAALFPRHRAVVRSGHHGRRLRLRAGGARLTDRLGGERGRGRVVEVGGQFLALRGQFVEPRGEAFGEAARVGEHDRGAMGADQVEHPFLDGGPDRRP